METQRLDLHAAQEATDELSAEVPAPPSKLHDIYGVPEPNYIKYRPCKFTHCEIHDMAFLGLCSSMIPYSDHNQAPRNTYMTNMGKQALGQNIVNGATKELVQATDPIIKCSIHDHIGLKGRGPGQTLQLAMVCWPNNSEDGVVMKQEYIERGGHMMIKILKYRRYRETGIFRYVGGDRFSRSSGVAFLLVETTLTFQGGSSLWDGLAYYEVDTCRRQSLSCLELSAPYPRGSGAAAALPPPCHHWQPPGHISLVSTACLHLCPCRRMELQRCL